MYASQLIAIEEMEKPFSTVDCLIFGTKLQQLPLLFSNDGLTCLLNRCTKPMGNAFWYCFREGCYCCRGQFTAGPEASATSAA